MLIFHQLNIVTYIVEFARELASLLAMCLFIGAALIRIHAQIINVTLGLLCRLKHMVGHHLVFHAFLLVGVVIEVPLVG